MLRDFVSNDVTSRDFPKKNDQRNLVAISDTLDEQSLA